MVSQVASKKISKMKDLFALLRRVLNQRGWCFAGLLNRLDEENTLIYGGWKIKVMTASEKFDSISSVANSINTFSTVKRNQRGAN